MTTTTQPAVTTTRPIPVQLHLRLTWPALFATNVALHLRLRAMLFDDAYIHLRIARNLLLHGHPFFNPGEPVMVTSSPLWTLLLATLRIPTHLTLFPILEAALITLVAALAYHLARPKTRTVAAAVTTFILLPASIGGMETPLAIALLLAAALLFQHNRPQALPILALAACTRLELLPILLAAAFTQRKHPRALLAAGAIVLTFAAAVYTQFGTLIPNAMHAKAIGYAYTRPQILSQLTELPLLTLPLAAALALLLIAARRQTLPSIAILTGLLIALEYVARQTPIFDWYRPLYTLPILLGAILYRPTSRPRGLLRLAAATMLLVVPAYHTERLLAAAITATPAARWAADRGDSFRVAQYLATANALHAACPAATLMSSEIGALGWAFPGPLIDAFGIATPAALPFQPLRSGAPLAGIPAAFAAQVHPDLIVSYTSLDAELRADPDLPSRYQLLQQPAAPPGSVTGWHRSTHLDLFIAAAGRCAAPSVQLVLRQGLAP